MRYASRFTNDGFICTEHSPCEGSGRCPPRTVSRPACWPLVIRSSLTMFALDLARASEFSFCGLVSLSLQMIDEYEHLRRLHTSDLHERGTIIQPFHRQAGAYWVGHVGG